jgi:hypothetical protein
MKPAKAAPCSMKPGEGGPILDAIRLAPQWPAREGCPRMVGEFARNLQPKPQPSLLRVKSKFCAVIVNTLPQFPTKKNLKYSKFV